MVCLSAVWLVSWQNNGVLKRHLGHTVPNTQGRWAGRSLKHTNRTPSNVALSLFFPVFLLLNFTPVYWTVSHATQPSSFIQILLELLWKDAQGDLALLSLQDLSKWKNRRRSVNSDIVKKKEEREKIEQITFGGNRRSKTFKEMQEER